jgi:hypothetical protein
MQSLTLLEKQVAKDLRRRIKEYLSSSNYTYIYTDKRIRYNMIRIKFYGFQSHYSDEELLNRLKHITKILTIEYEVFFLKPVIEHTTAYSRLGQMFHGKTVPCLFFYFNT